MIEFVLTIQDILERKSFKSAKVIAGSKGLSNQVKWSHILEIKEFETLINGGELILTTGVGLQLDLTTQISYLENLIEKNAAGMCIEIGPYFKEIPIELIKLADEHDFPLIIFEEVVRFVDITQDLHTLIINQHHQWLSQLDTLSTKFIDLSLSPNGILKILQELNHYFRQGVLFITDNSKSYYYPSEIKELETSIRSFIESSPSDMTVQRNFTLSTQTFALMPVKGLGQVWGHLCLQVQQPLSNEFFFLILDRAALAIAQILLRNRTIQERKQNMEDELVQNLIKGRDYEQDDVQTYLPAASRNMYFRIFVMQLNSEEINIVEEDWEELKLQRSMLVRSIFKRHGFFPAVSSKRSEIVVIASFIAADHLKEKTDRFDQIIQSIKDMKDTSTFCGNECKFGVSRVYKDIAQVKEGYVEAKKAITLKKSDIVNTYFYNDLGINRLLLLLIESKQLENYVHDYLDVILSYDKKYESDLFTTLCIYLECNGVKNETADRLFIVRQTLYNRLEKLETLLGSNFMEPSNRLALEVAIKAYQLLLKQNNNEGKPVFLV
ncbi:PucR family transcriptional regulator [Viridibacillus sp. FSL H8-0123]|uniref:PucR family transcriptional regulator n=1 Tax=Viridibacillus sp. FSL H8-0123 TaxID=1928922 RepID=UPI00097019C5|nr:PucR family transcriptional regulator [Viridibacillus sp. FSL H8-0123]OMC79976.1 PucR family transcriptional regulator [Viridibacillus sp. FSL H8-0123]